MGCWVAGWRVGGLQGGWVVVGWWLGGGWAAGWVAGWWSGGGWAAGWVAGWWMAHLPRCVGRLPYVRLLDQLLDPLNRIGNDIQMPSGNILSYCMKKSLTYLHTYVRTDVLTDLLTDVLTDVLTY